LKNSSPTTLILSGFEWQVPETDIRRLFEQIGEVLDLKMGKTPEGAPMATIIMAREQDAEDAILKYEGTHYRNVVLRVKRA
jgi:hypothetical protein